MAETSENKPIKHISIALLAHVDAGKTTLSESILYIGGTIRKKGRVDHKDTFLDNFQLEKERGITIFSKQAIVKYKDLDIDLLDTPGHVDFSTEMERTLNILDYAILVVSGTDGVQGHTETLWKLLDIYNVPTFIFVNKMDMADADKEQLIKNIKEKLGDGCIDFTDRDYLDENVAMCDENILDKYLETGSIEKQDIAELVRERKVFPCFFGSALKMQGVEEFLDGINDYTLSKKYGNDFGARVYKIARDEQGTRLTYMKITGGCLKVREELAYKAGDNEYSEKINQIRIYSGSRYDSPDEIHAGAVCAVAGLTGTFAGQGLGTESGNNMTFMQPVLNYSVTAKENNDMHGFYLKLKQLEEEEPQLHVSWSEKLQEIHIQLMGEVQTQVMKRLILDRYGIDAEFGIGNIVYKETIENAVEGVGHFEPLRHYAEVHLLMEPLDRGQGIIISSDCSEDVLDKNWQRLILTHISEREHPGVLTGSAITDIRITLVSGKSHLKHTEGGDFRQATYRAVRQGLKSAKSILLEPYYNFTLEIPADNVGRAMTDIQNMCGTFNPPDINGEYAVMKGRIPASTVQGYVSDVNSYTKGKGRLLLQYGGYDKCHNQDEVVEKSGYDSENDVENPTGSVFCSHGSGYNVPWNEVKEHMHLPGIFSDRQTVPIKETPQTSYSASIEDDKELQEIFERTFGPVKTRLNSSTDMFGYENKVHKEYKPVYQEKRQEYLLVDGYNIIFSWDELKELSDSNLEAARYSLMDILCNYQGFKQCTVILVFDAYKVKGNVGEVQKYNNIYVVYTKEAETADMYIEKAVHEMNKKYNVTVATSDGLEQLIIMGQGARRISAREFKEEIELVNKNIREEYLDKSKGSGNFVL
ncbi:MAG: GTP-binding protein [Lachnospiraceae bacterium]|nr:GTP-binding protein [Lachnospiraceae bacterium]